MMTIDDIEEMTSYTTELIFVFPYDIDIDRDKIIEYNRFKYAEFQKTASWKEHPYEDLDTTLTHYYWCCSINNLISKNDFFTLVKIMITEYESESFVSMLSDESKYFSIKSCNETFDVLYSLFPLCKSDNARSNLRAYLEWVFEDGFKWSDGVFRMDMLNEKNKSLFFSSCLEE